MWGKANKRIAELEARLEKTKQALSLEGDRARRLMARVETISKSHSIMENNLAKAQEKIEDQKKLIREQTEADLLLNALKAVGIIREEKPADYFGRASELQQQLNAVSQQQPRTAFPGIFGGVL